MKTNRNSEETYNRIVDVSRKLFFEKGYEKTSIQDIVNSLGDLTKGAIYYHFESKEKILDAVSKKVLLESNPFVEAKKIVGISGLDRIKRAFFIALQNEEQQTINKISLQSMDSPKLYCESIKTNNQVLAPALCELIEMGVADGTIKTDSCQEMAELILLCVNTWLLQSLTMDAIDSIERKIDLFRKMMKTLGIDLIDDELKVAFMLNMQKLIK